MTLHPRALTRPPTARHGQTMGSVLLLLSFLGVLAYSLHSAALDFRVQRHRLGLETGVQTLALSGLAAAAVRLQQMTRTDPALRALLLGNPPAGTAVAVDLQQEQELLLRSYPGASLQVTVELGAARGLAGETPGDATQQQRLRGGRGYDPVERRVPVNLTARAVWGQARHELGELRELAVVHPGPGTLGKFTLWARNVRPENGGLFRGTLDGAPAADNERLPLVLHNDGTVPTYQGSVPDSYRRRGYVFLGGEPNLKVAAGYLEYGELWTFLPMEDLSSLASAAGASASPPAFTDADPPDYFLRDYPPPPGAGLPGPYRFEIRHMVTGFWAGADSQGRRLDAIFPGAASMETPGSFAASSLLRLFGTAEVPSPTLVLGTVRRSYPELSGVLVDVNSDGAVDGLAAVMPELTDVFPAGLPPIPATVPGLGTSAAASGSIPLDNEGETTWPNMFDEGTYPAFASQLQARPYVEGYNFVYRTDSGAESFYPTDPIFPDFVESFELQPGGRPLYFEGAARDLSAADLVEKAAFRVGTEAGLLGSFLRRPDPSGPGELSLDATVVVEQAPGGVLRLSNLTVVRGGTLILAGAGDIALDQVRFAENLEFPLVLVAMNGNVRLGVAGTRSNPLPISVIAPRGTLLVDPNVPLELEGSLVVDTLDLDQLRAGGDVYYSRDLDPVDASYANNYRISLSDAALAW